MHANLRFKESAIFLKTLQAVFSHQYLHIKLDIDCFPFCKIVDEYYTLRIPKHQPYAYQPAPTLLVNLIDFHPPQSIQPILFRRLVLGPCFIHIHLPHEKILFSLKLLRRQQIIFLLVNCEQIHNPLPRELSQAQILVPKMM